MSKLIKSALQENLITALFVNVEDLISYLKMTNVVDAQIAVQYWRKKMGYQVRKGEKHDRSRNRKHEN